MVFDKTLLTILNDLYKLDHASIIITWLLLLLKFYKFLEKHILYLLVSNNCMNEF